MAVPPDQRSFSELVSDALTQMTALVRNEIQLARTEMAEKVSQASIGVGMLVASAGVAIAVLVVLLLAIAALLAAAGLPIWVAALLSAIIGAGLSAALAWAGVKRLKADALTPKRTIEQLQRDKLAAKETVT